MLFFFKKNLIKKTGEGMAVYSCIMQENRNRIGKKNCFADASPR